MDKNAQIAAVQKTMKEQGCPFSSNVLYIDTGKRTSVAVEIETDTLTFDHLVWFSEFFGTKDIDVNAETREGGYCETCAYTYAVQRLKIRNVTKGIPPLTDDN